MMPGQQMTSDESFDMTLVPNRVFDRFRSVSLINGLTGSCTPLRVTLYAR